MFSRLEKSHSSTADAAIDRSTAGTAVSRTPSRPPYYTEIKFVAVRITLLPPTGHSYRTLYIVPVKGAPGKLSPSILAGTFGSVPNQILCILSNSICYPLCFLIFVFPFYSSFLSSQLTVNVSVPSSPFLSLLCICSATNVVSFSLWRRDDMVVGNSGPLVSLSLLLLLLLHFSKAQYSEAVQPVCLIACHFQEASPLAQTEKFIHQMIVVRLIKCYCSISFGSRFCT